MTFSLGLGAAYPPDAKALVVFLDVQWKPQICPLSKILKHKKSDIGVILAKNHKRSRNWEKLEQNWENQTESNRTPNLNIQPQFTRKIVASKRK